MKHQTEPDLEFGGLIDDPNPFGPVENWERHLENLKTMPESIVRNMAMKRAEREIARIKQTRGRG